MPEWLKPFVTAGLPESSKRLVLVAASAVLILVTYGIGWACAYRIADTGEIGSGAVAALSLVAGITAALAGVAHRKPEPPAGGQP